MQKSLALVIIIVFMFTFLSSVYAETRTSSYSIDLSSTLGAGAISWDSYYSQINSGRVVDFSCSVDYNGGKNHNTLGVGYLSVYNNNVILYYDPYTGTERSMEYNQYKMHYWYETNYNITKVPA